MSGARPDTWMPLYWGDYLRDTGHLSTAEHGAYMLLIGHYWTTGKPLFDDDDLLRRICRMSSREWKVSRETLAALFHVSDGIWQHKRVDSELRRAEERSIARSKAGSKGVAKRWQNHSKRIANAPVCDKQNDTQSQLQSQSSREPDSASPLAPRANGLSGVPSNWTPSEGVVMWARLQKWLKTPFEAEIEAFKAYSIGNGKSYADVDQAFKSWLIKARQFARKSGETEKPKGGEVYIP